MFHLYKAILNFIPTGVVVLDKKYRVRYTNASFRQHFKDGKIEGSLHDVLRCTLSEKCGNGKECEVCPFKLAFKETLERGKEDFHKLVMPVEDENGTAHLALQIKVRKLGKYALGILDDSYQTEIARELKSAQSIQRRLLPSGSGVGELSYAYLYHPCREIGGDLPDIYEIGGDTVGLVADVSGKGISAGLLSGFVKAGWDKSEPSPAKALQKLNAKFSELNMDERSYITAEAVRIDPVNRTITYSAAGHVVPILLKNGFKINEIAYPSAPISNWMEFDYRDNVMYYASGDMLVLLTDGIVESKNKYGEQFGIERVESVLMRTHTAQSFIDRLKAELYEFCETVNDDLTAIAFVLN
ncbi:MAG: SpoIIE family protein phosphatase [Clostridia bacterium]|nr:SpoIIE family protein phosphatase [Clostridia bacterium]